MSINDEMKTILLGEKSAYRWNGRRLEQVPVQVFSSYPAFEEASRGNDFKEKIADMSAVYAVLRTVEEAQKNPSGYREFKTQLQNPDLVIPAGGKTQLQAMLVQAKSFEWDRFGSHHDGYQRRDTGRIVGLDKYNCGVGCNGHLNTYGMSVGVMPKALRVRSVALENLLLNVERV